MVFASGYVIVDIHGLLGSLPGSGDAPDIEIAGFLDGFEIPDSREFSLWKDRIQGQILPKVTKIFSLRVERCRKHGDIRQIEYLANRMLALDELCEEAVRAKMEVLALTGDRLAALKLYEEWRYKVAEELSAAPSESLASMATQLRRRGWEQALVADLPTPPLNQRRAKPFVGRTAEYRDLYEAWEAVRARDRAHAMVLGDSGVGKTTLVDRFSAAASLEGAAVTRVQCYDLDREIPYSTVAGLVLGLLDRPEVLGTPPEALGELSRIVPQLRQKFGSIPLPKETHGETARIELTEALHQLLDALTETSPAVLVVDDVHLADEASLAVLHLLVRRALDQSTMFIMIARPAELTLGSQGRLFRDQARELGIREIDIQPLNGGESLELLSQLLLDVAIAPPKHVKNALLEAAGGYPMVLELLVQDWEANGGNSLGLALDAMTEDLQPGVDHTAAYQRALSRIFRSLDPTTRTVVYLASILGSRLNDLAMYSLANLSLGQTMAGLAQLADLRVLRDSSRGLEFVNELIRAHIYASIPSTIRRALHGAIADRLCAEEELSSQSAGLEIAWHCVRAGRQDQAWPHLLRGARQAMRQGAPHVAERALESAVPTLNGDNVPAALLLLAEAMQEQGRWRESLDVLTTLPNLESQDVRWWATVLAAAARRNLGASLAEETRAEIPLLTLIIRESTDSRMRVAAARTVANVASMERDASAASRLLSLVSEIPVTDLDDDTQAQLSLTRGQLLWLTGNVPESYSEVERAVEALTTKRIANTVATQLTLGLGTLRMHQGRYADALTHYERASQMANRLGNDTQLAFILGNSAMCHGRIGNYREQLDFSLKAPRTWGHEFGGLLELQLSYCQILALTMLGNTAQAITVIKAVDLRLQQSLPAWMRQAWLLWKADLFMCVGNQLEADKIAKQVFQDFGMKPHSPGFAGPFARWLGHLAQAEGIQETARLAVEDLLQRLSMYDALDQVEILCAARAIDAAGMRGYDSLIRERLYDLPSEVARHLKRVGSLA